MIRRLAPALLAVLAAAGCATMNVSSHVESGINTANYHTFAWGTPDPLPTGDPRLDQDPFFNDHIQGAVEKEMAAHGFTLADRNPDLLIHYHAVIRPRMDINRIDQEHGYCYDEGCTARVFDYEEGTLVLDVMDAHTNRIIWRGWAQDTIAAALKNDDRMTAQINQAVRRMLARFPRPL